jgi:heptosyltransferase I
MRNGACLRLRGCNSRRTASISTTDIMLRILLVKTSSLGDVVHNFPAVTDLRRHLPNAEVHWVVEEAYAPLVALHPGVDEVIPVAIRRWRRSVARRATWREYGALRRRLASRPYDRIIDSQGLIKSAWIASLAAGEHVGFSKQTAREAMASRFYDSTFHIPRDLHAVERNRMLTALAIGCGTGGPIDYGLRDQRGDTETAPPYAVLLHGTSREDKEWQEDAWRATGNALAKRGLHIILPWGSAKEELRSRRLAEGIAVATVPPRRSLDQMAAMLAAARLIVGVDTGLVHLGAALQVPTVAIFRGSDPALTGPVGRGPIAICGSAVSAPTVADVLSAVDRIMADAC